MQNLNVYENQTLLSMQLARLIPAIPPHYMQNYANTLLIQALLNLHTASTDLKALTDSHEAFSTKLHEGRLTEGRRGTSEASLIKSEVNKDQSSTSPSSILNIAQDTKKVKQENDAAMNIKYDHATIIANLRGTDIVKIEESEGLLKRSKKITKEKTSLKNIERSPYQLECKENIKKRRGKKPTWNAEEDSKLAQLVELHGQKWTQISSLMGNKTAKQARDRYINFLRPGIETAEWTENQEKLLESLVEKHGRKWSKIASELSGRTENQVKNKYYCIMNKRFRENKATLAKETEDHGEAKKVGSQTWSKVGNVSIPLASENEANSRMN